MLHVVAFLFLEGRHPLGVKCLSTAYTDRRVVFVQFLTSRTLNDIRLSLMFLRFVQPCI
jgi:hypothetical protein